MRLDRPEVIRLVSFVRVPRDIHRRRITRKAVLARDGWTLPVLRLRAARPDRRPRHPAQPRRRVGLGEHRRLLRPLQPPQGQPHAARDPHAPAQPPAAAGPDRLHPHRRAPDARPPGSPTYPRRRGRRGSSGWSRAALMGAVRVRRVKGNRNRTAPGRHPSPPPTNTLKSTADPNAAGTPRSWPICAKGPSAGWPARRVMRALRSCPERMQPARALADGS